LPNLQNCVLFSLDLYGGTEACRAEILMSYRLRESETDGFRRFLAALDLKRFVRPESAIEASLASNRSNHLLLSNTSPAPKLWPELIKSLRQQEWTGGNIIKSIQLTVIEREVRYAALRVRLNAIVGGWDCQIPGGYCDGFDPFSSPPCPPAREEYRFPVA